jgi:hypothetical protein
VIGSILEPDEGQRLVLVEARRTRRLSPTSHASPNERYMMLRFAVHPEIESNAA